MDSLVQQMMLTTVVKLPWRCWQRPFQILQRSVRAPCVRQGRWPFCPLWSSISYRDTWILMKRMEQTYSPTAWKPTKICIDGKRLPIMTEVLI